MLEIVGYCQLHFDRATPAGNSLVLTALYPRTPKNGQAHIFIFFRFSKWKKKINPFLDLLAPFQLSF